LTSQRVTP